MPGEGEQNFIKGIIEAIEFVRQTIGHSSLNATSGYVSEMGDQERQNRISSIK